MGATSRRRHRRARPSRSARSREGQASGSIASLRSDPLVVVPLLLLGEYFGGALLERASLATPWKRSAKTSSDSTRSWRTAARPPPTPWRRTATCAPPRPSPGRSRSISACARSERCPEGRLPSLRRHFVGGLLDECGHRLRL